MYINVTTSNDMDFDDIYQNSWSGVDEVGFTDEEVETIKKQLRKGHDLFGVGRFVIRYYKDMQ